MSSLALKVAPEVDGFGSAANTAAEGVIGAAAVRSALAVWAGNNLEGYSQRANHLLFY
jgi:hypothetical protein